MITLGKTADIKSMMMELNKRKSFVDLKFVCEDGDLYAHKFIIGAQSKYLRKLMANDQSDEEITIFHLPDIQSKILKIVLKFLYTGRLLIFRGQVAVVKELLENVLHIDAKITLPETASLARPSSSRNRDDDDENDGGANNRSKKRHRPGSPSSNGGSKKSKKSSSDRSLNTPSPPHGNRHGPLDLDAAPPSPPYSLHGGDDDDDDVDRDCGGGPSDVDDPDVVDVDDDKSDDDVKFEGEKSRNDQKEEHQIYSCPHCPDIFVKKSHLIGHAKKYHTEQYGLIEAPGIISKHTGGKSKFLAKKSTGGSGLARKSTSGGGGSIPSAPSIIAKRPGVSSMRAQKSKKKVTQRRTDLIRESQAPPGTRYDNDDNDDDDVDYQPPESSINDIDPVPSTSSGITDADRQPQDFLPGAEDMNISASDVQEYFASLPNPLPEAPSKDSIMYRGEWISKRKYAAIKKRNAERLSNNSKPRPYNYKPFITITGTSKPDTIEEAHTGEDGHFPCMHCSATFTRERSLQVHISRSHNENMKANCPECGKGLSSTAAIKKHLLSHRPSTQWPIMCPLCGKRFQAKGDMPKHLVTKLHENDDIPPIGSSAWKELIDRSVLLPQMHLNRTGIRKGYVGAAVAAAAQDDANSEVVYETEEGSIDDPPLPPPPPRPQSEANSSTGAGEEIMVASPASSIAETKPALGVGLEMTTDQDGAPMPAPSLPPIRPIPTTTQPDQKPTVLTPPELPPATLRSSFQAPAQIQPQIQHPQQPPEQQQYEAAIQQQYQASIQQQQQYPAPIAKPEAVVPDADVAPIAPAPSSSHGASAFHPVLPAGGIVYNSDGFPVARCSHPLASPSPLPPQSANGVENETTFTMGPNGSLMPKPEDNR